MKRLSLILAAILIIVGGVHAQSWLLLGNSGTIPGTNFLGTTDNQALEVKVNSLRALRIEPNSKSPNIIGGYSGNSVATGAYGASIGGGGASGGLNRISSASAYCATIAGGINNNASANYATISGGVSNTASGPRSTVCGGQNNTASGSYSTVAGGESNTAAGTHSFAGGYRAKTNHNGTFVWADVQAADVASTATNQFIVRASGGMWFGTNSSPSIPAGRFINTSTGGYLSTGGTWTNSSDRELKEGFTQVDEYQILEEVAELPITVWNYRAEGPSVTHIGPVGQDFYTAFGFGADETSISTVDASGVALASIQALYRENQAKDAEIDELRSLIRELENRLGALERAQ